MKRTLLIFYAIVLCLSGAPSCSYDYPVTPEGMVHVYPGQESGDWVYVYRDKTYYNLQEIPDKGTVTKVFVSGKRPLEEKKELQPVLNKVFGESVEVIYDRDVIPPLYRQPIIIPRPILF